MYEEIREMMKFNLVAVIIIVVSMVSSTNVVAEGQCHYTSSTTTENGVITSKKETKVCNEVEQIGGNDYLTDEQFETLMIMSFIFILENVL